MAQHGLSDAPTEVKREVQTLVKALHETLGDGLVGVYVHGSLAFGCFNPSESDIDVLAVTRERMSTAARRALMERLLVLSGDPSPIEISIMNERQLRPWRHPAPFDFHFSEGLRKRFAQEFAGGTWISWYDKEQLDDDLAAHITVARARGVVLWGAPAAKALPEVPPADYVASLLSDIEWARGRADVRPEDRILNLCRVCAYLRDGRVLSKEEGGAWALQALSGGLQCPIETALLAYRADGRAVEFDEAVLATALSYLQTKVNALAKGRSGPSLEEDGT